MVDASPESIIHWPALPMSRYGLKPPGFGGGNLFRLIWAPSRRVTLQGKPPYTVGMYAPYRGMAPVHPLTPFDVWILEKWLPPGEITDKTKEEWNRDPACLVMGPYPSKGDYCLAASPLGCNPDAANIDKLVAWVQNRKSSYENGVFIRDQLEKQQKAKKDEVRARIDNRLLKVSGGEAIVGYGGHRGTKTTPQRYTANELGLPTQSGYSGMLKNQKPVRYEIPNAGNE